MSILLTASLAAGAAAAAVHAVKKNQIEPAEVLDRAKNAVKLNVTVDEKYNNGAALTPPMGWSSWNCFRTKINEMQIYEIAEALKNSGLADCGYTYVNLDDCWQSSQRDENGELQGDLLTFPSGIPALVKKVNGLGLKLGLYSSNGTLTCEDLPTCFGREYEDAATFARWGIEYFKHDFGHNVPIPTVAPGIVSLSVSDGSGQNETVYGCEDAYLIGKAHISQDAKVTGGQFINGLSAACGAAEYTDITAEADGEYVLTLMFRKNSKTDLYCEILINNEKVYPVALSSTMAGNGEARHQITVTLKAGKNTLKIYNPVGSRQDSAAMQYDKMGKALMQATAAYAAANGVAEKPIVYSICEWGMNFPWKWGPGVGNLWRTTMDIKPVWASVLGIYEFTVMLGKHAGPGGWNDPDMLEVGNGNLTEEECRSHFTLWCMMAAPLILGNDIREFIKEDGTPDTENWVYRILSNRAVIALDQDALGQPCRRVKTNALQDVLVKPLSNGECALCFFNKTSRFTDMMYGMNTLAMLPFVSLPAAGLYEATDLWSGKAYQVEGNLVCKVPPHGVRVFRINAQGSKE